MGITRKLRLKESRDHLYKFAERNSGCVKTRTVYLRPVTPVVLSVQYWSAVCEFGGIVGPGLGNYWRLCLLGIENSSLTSY